MATSIDDYAEARPLDKHRLEARPYSVDFAAEIPTGEALTGTPTVRVVTIPTTGAASDVSSEFSLSDVQVSGTTVAFMVGAADAGEQDGGTYHVIVEVDTDGTPAAHLVSVHELTVSEQGDPAAPQ